MAPPSADNRGLVGESYVSPNRMWAVVTTLRSEGGRMALADMERAVMPTPGLGKRGRVTLDLNLREAKAANLVIETDGVVEVSPAAPPSVLDLEADPAVALADAVLLASDGRNDALGFALSWILDLDPYGPDSERLEASIVGRMANDQVDSLTRVTNDITYGALSAWATGLGFARASPFDADAIAPDPTRQLRLRLPALFDGGGDLSFAEVTSRLSRLVPVFEGGAFREAIPSGRPEGHLSASTSLAWLRLEHEGLVQLSQPSDADVMVLTDADGSRPVSHVTRLD